MWGAALLTWAQDLARAQSWAQETTRLCAELGETWLMGGPLMLLAFAAMLQADLNGAAEYLREGIGVLAQSGDRLHTAVLQMSLSGVARLEGRPIEALNLLRESLATSEELGHLGNAAACMVSEAGVLATHGDPRTAARLLGAADGIRTAAGVVPLPISDALNAGIEDAVKHQLGADVYAALAAGGRGLSVEEAVEAAMTAGERALEDLSVAAG